MYIYIYLQHQGVQNFSRCLEQQKKKSLLQKNVLDGEKHRLALMPLTTPAACASSRLSYTQLREKNIFHTLNGEDLYHVQRYRKSGHTRVAPWKLPHAARCIRRGTQRLSLQLFRGHSLILVLDT